MHLDLIDWVKQCEQLGAGEICLNSIDADGTKEGFDLPMLKAVCDAHSRKHAAPQHWQRPCSTLEN